MTPQPVIEGNVTCTKCGAVIAWEREKPDDCLRCGAAFAPPQNPQPVTLQVEREAGVRARHVVYYRRNGKRYIDGVYSPTAEQARSDFLAMAKELGWNVEIDRVEVRS